MYTLLCTLEEEGAPTNKTSGKYTREGKKNDFQGGRSWKEFYFNTASHFTMNKRPRGRK